MHAPTMIVPLLIPWLALAPCETDELAEVLAAARDAAGYEEQRETPLRARGEATYRGAKGPYLLELHPSGAFKSAIAGPLPHAVASDGTTVWEVDWSGLPARLELADRERAKLLAAVMSGSWLDERAPVTVALGEDRGDGDELEVSLRDGGESAELTLDPKTKLLRSFRIGETTWHLDDYRSPLGFPFAHRVRQVEEGGMEHVVAVATLERAPDMKPSDLAMPVAPADARFDAEVPAEIESKLAETGHLLVHPRVSAKDVGWFIVDTGAGALCIDPKVARELELETVGSVTASGIGGKVPAGVRRGGELQVGPLTIANPTWVELDLAFLEPYFGVPVAGILGYDFFARAVVAVDAKTPRVEVHDPSRYALPEDEKWAHLVLDEHLPCVEARFEKDRTGVFRIDTGATGTVVFQATAVSRWGLLDGRETKEAAAGGVGGFVKLAAGELEWFELGGHRFEPVEATFEREHGPLKLSDHVAGTIGGGLLEPFTMVLDYREGRVAFVRR